MKDDEIFELAESNGFQDDFGRWNFTDDNLLDFVHELRQALAQPEQEQKTPLKVLNLTVFTENRLRNGRVYDVETLQAMTNRDILAIPDIGKKALKEVLEALDVYAVNMSQERVDETAKCKHDTLGSEWAECVKLPIVVHVRKQRDGETHISTREGITPVLPDDLIMRGVAGEEYPIGRELFERTYTFDTAPPKREWVGLTDDEMQEAGRYSYCRGGTSEKLYHIMWNSQPSASVGWCRAELIAFAQTIEAKLKEKNT